MTLNDSELLMAYVRDGSEPAFTELVGRHIGLVYATALRQVNGASHLAEDITQKVFTSLAQKASRLTGHTSLAGWLYTSVRYAASDTRRAEQRRTRREQESYAMNKLSESEGPAPDWEQLRPVIDDTLSELDDEDREAILLRFFQGCPLAEIGARLGLKENTARMRVERALDKLRLALAKRKITSTAAALATSLTGYAMSVAPAGMAARISSAALIGSAAAVGGGTAILPGGKIAKLFMVAAVMTAIVLPLIHHRLAMRQAVAQLPSSPEAGMNNGGTTPVPQTQNTSGPSKDSIALMDPRLDIYFDDPKTGKPVPGITVEDRCWSKSGFKTKQFYSDKNGWCEVTYPSNVTELELTTRLDSYADTRLEWHPDHGDIIPVSYTLHLAPAVLIGGQVVDANGAPVAGAKVGWNHEDAPLVDTLPENHQFGWIETTTDADGHWQINRIADDMIRRLYGSAKDSDYVDTPLVFVGRDPSAEKALRAGTYVFKLGNATAITGSVVDAEGNPVAGARVFTGTISSSDARETVADGNGDFTIPGCKPGDNLLTAEAHGLANTTIGINTTNDPMPYQIVLSKGGVLSLLVENQNGVPIPDASAWLDCFNQGPINSPHFKAKRTQVDFTGKSDAKGRILWTNTPAGELKFEFSAPGYVRSEDFYFKADGEEHLITLHPALVVSGSVRDADSGQLIPNFRMGIGWPEKDYLTGQTNGHWSSIARFWPQFSDGQFSNAMEEAALGGTPNPGYVLKFEADGYKPFISRPIAPDESQVHLDVALHPAVSLTVTVIGPGGQPVADADVGLVSPDAQLSLVPGGFSKGQSGAALLYTDAAGHFSLTLDGAVTRVIVACPAGYAETNPADLQANPAITLQAWGRLEGTCLSNGQPVAGREYLFSLHDDDINSVSADFNAFRVTADEQGKFVLPMVPPGKHNLVRLIRTQVSPVGMGWMYGDKTQLDVQSGQTTTITIDDKGYTVTAKLQWSGGMPPANLQQVMVSLRTPLPPLPPEIVGHQDLIQKYYQSPEFRAQTHQYQMGVNADGLLEADNVPAGTYTLSAFAMLQAPAGKPSLGLDSSPISVTVPADPPTGKLDAGTIEMPGVTQ